MKNFSALAADNQQEADRLFAEDLARQLPELSQLTRVESKVRGHVLLYRAGDSSNPFYVKELGELYDYYNPDDQLQEQIRVRNRRISLLVSLGACRTQHCWAVKPWLEKMQKEDLPHPFSDQQLG